ncbi:MAG: hypothetical protein K2P81_14870 [Bacteriovoracaceae bacterium]|nr:hypothetical protein [Bacteriovoracaceae bacterium]
MKFFITFILLFSHVKVMAQANLDETFSNVVDVVTNESLQKNADVVNATVDLEQQVSASQSVGGCLEDVPQEMSCDSLKKSLLSESYAKQGWKVLFEAKYIPTDVRGDHRIRGTGDQSFTSHQGMLDSFYSSPTHPETAITNQASLDAEAKKLANYWGRNKEDFYGALILRNLQKTKNYDEMMTTFKGLSAQLTDQQYLEFLSTVAGWADYNDQRSKFKQQEGAGLGVVSPFDQIMQTKAGICGDIHSMVAKFAEQRGWEAFTVGYAMAGDQHVVTSVVDPKDPNKLMVVNYGRYEEQALNDGNSIMPVPATSWGDVGMQLRIFKNKSSNGGDGEMQQIATIPTPLGSMMASLFKSQGQIEGAMPANENFSLEKFTFQNDKIKVASTEDGGVKERVVSEGIVIYEGRVDNAEVYGVAVSHQVFNKLYGYDPKLKKCVQRKSKYFSIGLANNFVQLPQEQMVNQYYVYLNMKGGQIISLFETPHFQFKGLVGYELDMFASFAGGFSTGDANLKTFAGVLGEYKKNGLAIAGGMSLETNLGLKNQNLMTDFSALPSNIAPFSFNALKTDFSIQKNLNSQTTLFTNNSLIMSRVGNRLILSTGVIVNNTSVMLSYQGGMKAMNIGNSLQNINLLQNFNQNDGYKLSVGQNFLSKNGGATYSVSGWVGMTTSTMKPEPFAGATLKIKFNAKKKKKKFSLDDIPSQ